MKRSSTKTRKVLKLAAWAATLVAIPDLAAAAAGASAAPIEGWVWATVISLSAVSLAWLAAWTVAHTFSRARRASGARRASLIRSVNTVFSALLVLALLTPYLVAVAPELAVVLVSAISLSSLASLWPQGSNQAVDDAKLR